MKQLTTTFAIAALSLAPAALLADPVVEKTTTTEAKEEKKADQEVVVTCNDLMQYDKKEIEVKAGQTIKITLKNVGKAPKIAMGHNLVVLNKGADLNAWAMKAMTAKDTDYVPTDKEAKKSVLAHTKLLGPDESDSITFEIKEAGEYEYLCSFPGHFALMRGKIIAK
jgi:azurin